MTREFLPPGNPSRDRFARLSTGAFRLETLPAYAGWSDDPMFAAFRAGEPFTLVEAMHEWIAALRGDHDRGIRRSRVHVVTEPLTEYLRFEATWGYAPLVAAGEDIRIVDATDGWPPGVPRGDFWLVDDEVYWMRYDPDGVWLGSEWTDDPAEVAEAVRARDAAWSASARWAEWVAAHPDLAALVPVVP